MTKEEANLKVIKELNDKGLIHKTNKNKTFHLCNTSSEHEHNAVLAICNDCGIVEELKTKLFSKIIKHVKCHFLFYKLALILPLQIAY